MIKPGGKLILDEAVTGMINPNLSALKKLTSPNIFSKQ